MWNLPNALAGAGLVDDAVVVADALAGVDVGNDHNYAGDAATILAGAGRNVEARARVEANLKRWPDDPFVRIQAGEALAALGIVGQRGRSSRRRSGSPRVGGTPPRSTP